MPDTETLDTWRQNVLRDWTDSRIVPAPWVDAHIWFFLHSYADFANSGLVLNGWSFREDDRGYLLILRVRKDDIPYVVFIGSGDPTRCMSKLRKLLRDGGVELIKDKYR